jgi:hypothetical protein
MNADSTPTAQSSVRIELTDSQRQRVAQALGDARVASEKLTLEMSIAELEQRIVPRILTN